MPGIDAPQFDLDRAALLVVPFQIGALGGGIVAELLLIALQIVLVLDLGRSKIGTGAHAFKRNWGFEPTPMHYRYRLKPGQSVPEINPLNPKYRVFIAAWKRLPLPVANTIGPLLARGLG